MTYIAAKNCASRSSFLFLVFAGHSEDFNKKSEESVKVQGALSAVCWHKTFLLLIPGTMFALGFL